MVPGEPEELSQEEAQQMMAAARGAKRGGRRAVTPMRSVRPRYRPQRRSSLAPLVTALLVTFGMLAVVIVVGRATAEEGDSVASSTDAVFGERVEISIDSERRWTALVDAADEDRREAIASEFPDLTAEQRSSALESARQAMPRADFVRLTEAQAWLRNTPQVFFATKEEGSQLRRVAERHLSALATLTSDLKNAQREECVRLGNRHPDSVGQSEKPARKSPALPGAESEEASLTPPVEQVGEGIDEQAAKLPASSVGPQDPKLSPEQVAQKLCYGVLGEEQVRRLERALFTGGVPLYAMDLRPLLCGKPDAAVSVEQSAIDGFIAEVLEAGGVALLQCPYAVRMLEQGVREPRVMFMTVEALSQAGMVDLAAKWLAQLSERLAGLRVAAHAAGREQFDEVLSLVPAREAFADPSAAGAWLEEACSFGVQQLLQGSLLSDGWLKARRHQLLLEDYVKAVQDCAPAEIRRCAEAWRYLDPADPMPWLLEALTWESGSLGLTTVEKAGFRNAVRKFRSLHKEQPLERSRVVSLGVARIASECGLPDLDYEQWFVSKKLTYFFPDAAWISRKIKSRSKDAAQLQELRAARAGFNLPDAVVVQRRVAVPRSAGKMLSGNSRIEDALYWLVQHQDASGRWDCDGFSRHDHPSAPSCGGEGGASHDIGVTGLALLALLEAGHDPRGDGEFADASRRASDWLCSQQQENGLLGSNAFHDFVYDHAVATYALARVCQLYEGGEALRKVAQRGVDYLEAHRNPHAVWRYQPRDNDNDISITGWCVAALSSAKAARLTVNPVALAKSSEFLDRVSDDTGKHGYTKRGEGSSRKPGDHGTRFPIQYGATLTAVGLHCRLLLGQQASGWPVMSKAAAILSQKLPDSSPQKIDHSYWYHGTCAMRGMGGRGWQNWRAKVSGVLHSTQRSGVNVAGSWDPAGPWGADGGRVYSTAMSALALMKCSSR